MLIVRILPYAFLAAMIGGIFFLWHQVPLPCKTPIEYRIGTFDSRFELIQADFLREATAAEALWEEALGRELFRFVPGAVFPVNLIYDERQEQTVEARALENSLGKTEDKEKKLDQEQQKVLAEYEEASRSYEQKRSSFEKHLDAYNADVEKWNKRGGASPEKYAELEEVLVALEKERDSVEVERRRVNALVKKVNAFSEQKVAVIEAYNEQVEEYVGRYGTSREFDQGEYVGEEINIYQYEDLPHLRAVLAHEFGHALGLAHGNDPQSVMFHLMQEQPLNPIVLTAEDKAMLLAQCDQTLWDIAWERISILKERVLTGGEVRE